MMLSKAFRRRVAVRFILLICVACVMLVALIVVAFRHLHDSPSAADKHIISAKPRLRRQHALDPLLKFQPLHAVVHVPIVTRTSNTLALLEKHVRDTTAGFSPDLQSDEHATNRLLVLHSVYGMWDHGFRLTQAEHMWPPSGRHMRSSPAFLLRIAEPAQTSLRQMLQAVTDQSGRSVDTVHSMWDRPRLDQLLAYGFKHAPDLFLWFSVTIASCPKPVQAADLWRYMLIYLYGGLYFDVDCYPTNKPFSDLLLRAAAFGNSISNQSTSIPTAIVFGEHVLSDAQRNAAGTQYRIRGGVAEDAQRIGNYALGASGSGSRFWLAALLEASDRVSQAQVREDYDILYTTGPDVLSSLFARCTAILKAADSHSSKVPQLFPTAMAYTSSPGVRSYIESIRRELQADAANWCQFVLLIPQPEDQQYFRHHATGRWRQVKLG
jgi:hypothetical protein